MKVFDLETYVRSCFEANYTPRLESWQLECNQKEVINGKVGIFTVYDKWCKDKQEQGKE